MCLWGAQFPLPAVQCAPPPPSLITPFACTCPLQKLGEAEAQLRALQAARQEEEGPLAAREQQLATVRSKKKIVVDASRDADAKMLGDDAVFGGSGGGGGGRHRNAPGLVDQVKAAVSARVRGPMGS